MHYLGHLNALKPALSIGENLEFWQKFCGTPLMSVDEALELAQEQLDELLK